MKKELLDREYNNLQRFLRGDKTAPLYSANKQQALRYYRKVKQKEYPLSLRNDLINLRKAFWFLKIPVYGVRGGSESQLNLTKNFQMENFARARLLERRTDTLPC
jgi:putative transposase